MSAIRGMLRSGEHTKASRNKFVPESLVTPRDKPRSHLHFFQRLKTRALRFNYLIKTISEGSIRRKEEKLLKAKAISKSTTMRCQIHSDDVSPEMILPGKTKKD